MVTPTYFSLWRSSWFFVGWHNEIFVNPICQSQFPLPCSTFALYSDQTSSVSSLIVYFSFQKISVFTIFQHKMNLECEKSWARLSSWTSFLQTLPFRPSVILLRPTEVSLTKRERAQNSREKGGGQRGTKTEQKGGSSIKQLATERGQKECVCETQNSNPIHK